jgi:hypothetical protein
LRSPGFMLLNITALAMVICHAAASDKPMDSQGKRNGRYELRASANTDPRVSLSNVLSIDTLRRGTIK